MGRSLGLCVGQYNRVWVLEPPFLSWKDQMSARSVRLTSRRPETPKVKLRVTHDMPRSLRIHQRSQGATFPILKTRNQFGDVVLEKPKDCAGVDPASPSAKRRKIRPDAIQPRPPVPGTHNSPPNVSGIERENLERGGGRVLRPRKRQTASTSGSGSYYSPGGFRKVRLLEDDYFRAINRRIKVFWDIDNRWYSGWIKRYDSTNRLHHVVYEDHDEEWVSLERDIFELEVLPGESLGLSSEEAPQKGGVHDSQMDAIQCSQKRRSTRGERLRTDAQRSRGGHTDDSAKCGMAHAPTASFESGEYVATSARDDYSRLGSAVGGFGGSAFSRGSDDACETSLVSQTSIDESSKPPGVELVSGKNSDVTPAEPEKRRTIVKTYYRKRRRKLRNSETVGDAGNEIRLQNAEKTPNTCCREHPNESQCTPSCHPSLAYDLRLFDRGLAKISGIDSGFIPNVEMEICIVENLSGSRKLCFWGTFCEVLIKFYGVLTVILGLGSEGKRCPALASVAPGHDVLPPAAQSITAWLWTPWGRASSPFAHNLENRDEWTAEMLMHLNGLLTQVGILRNSTSPLSITLVLDGSFYTLRPGIGFANDFELNNAGDHHFISGLPFGNPMPQRCSRRFLCVTRRIRDLIVIAKTHRRLPSFSLAFGSAPNMFMALHLKLLLGNMTGLSRALNNVAGSSYTLNGPDVNNSKADIVECNNTIFSAFRFSEAPTDDSSVKRNLLEARGNHRALGGDLTAWFNMHGFSLSEHSKIEAVDCPRNTSADLKAEASSRFSGCSLSVARTAGGTSSQDILVLPVLKFRAIDTGKWRLIGISKPSSTERETPGVIKSGIDCVSLLPAVHEGFREEDTFGAGADSSGPVELSTSGCPSSTFEAAGDGSSKSQILGRRRGRPSRKDKEDRIKEIQMDSSDMGPDLASLTCCANILLIGEDRCWRESDATVKLESAALNEWLLVVKLHGLTKFTHKPREQKSGTSKRSANANSIIWKGGRDWRLEFSDKSQWNLFKEMHAECYYRNLRAASIRCIPIPGVRLLDDNDCCSGVPFVRPSLMYIQMAESETTRALSSSRVVYDMDSDDEEWLSQFNSGIASDGGCKLGKVAEETFEKIIDKLEKAAFRQQSECLDVDEVAKTCSGLGPMEELMAVHAYWLEKRKKAGIALVRQLRVPPSPAQIQSNRKKLFQKQRSIKLSVGGRHLVRNQRIGMVGESRIREARAAARSAAELAATKRARARRLMQIADLATYRAVAITKNAEAIQAIETSCSFGQFPNENCVAEEGSGRPLVEDLLNFLPWVHPVNGEAKNKLQLHQRQSSSLNLST